MVRAHKPAKLISWLKDNYKVYETCTGIYYIEQAGLFAVQLIVSDELPEKAAIWLQSLTDRMEKQQAEKLLAELEKTRYGRYERMLIESILKVSMTANKKLYQQVGKEEATMFDALREIMAADFQKAENAGEMRAKKETATELAEMGMPAEKIARAVKVSVRQVEYRLRVEESLPKGRLFFEDGDTRYGQGDSLCNDNRRSRLDDDYDEKETLLHIIWTFRWMRTASFWRIFA